MPAFLKFTLVLAVICALGIVWEYRFHYNVFHDAVRHSSCPGFFQVGTVDPAGQSTTSAGADAAARPTIRSRPSAWCRWRLPIALVGIIHSSERRSRILYGLAACILLAASISTYRKSALLAPVAVAFTIAYFRRSELLRLAPLAALVARVRSTPSPPARSARSSSQLQPSRLGVGTVSDRASDYDAVRPDLWTHLLFGRGYGTYDHVSYRVLDSEVLSRIVDTGVLGLLAFCPDAGRRSCSRRAGRSGRATRVWAPPALAVAAAAVAYLVLAFLFDVSSFPHTPYILMSLAGLLAVIVTGPDEEAAPPAAGRPPRARRGGSRRRSGARRRSAHISYERTR